MLLQALCSADQHGHLEWCLPHHERRRTVAIARNCHETLTQFDQMKRLRRVMDDEVHWNIEDYNINISDKIHSRHSMSIDDCLPDDVDDATLVQMFDDMSNKQIQTTVHGGSRISEHAEDDENTKADDRNSEHADIDEEINDRISEHADDVDEIELERSSSDDSIDSIKTKPKKRKVNGHRSENPSSKSGSITRRSSS